jgi:L-ascorbate metabolism protein UlaG (beta-lactamase superfamily)
MRGTALKNRTNIIAPALTLVLLMLAGCSGYVSRIVQRSLEHLIEPVEPAPRIAVNPILSDVGLSILWVGHATMVIQIHDKVFITDPAFTDAIGMIAKRFVGPGVDPSSLTRVDYILISHIHMDHFSYGSLEMLPKHGKLLIPFGAAAYTPEFGFAETREIKAWDKLDEDGVTITAVPVQHFGGRYGFDVSWYPDRGYTGWVIQYKGKTVFIAGDTGYHPEYFKEIGRRFTVDVAIVPIGPTGSGGATGVGGRVHVSPRGAVQIFEDVKAKMMVPMHYRTFFQGSQQAPTFAEDLLRQVVEEKGYGDRIRILDIGEQQVFSSE